MERAPLSTKTRRRFGVKSEQYCSLSCEAITNRDCGIDKPSAISECATIDHYMDVLQSTPSKPWSHAMKSIRAEDSAEDAMGASNFTIRFRRPGAPGSLIRMTVPNGEDATRAQRARLEALGYSVEDVIAESVRPNSV